MQYVADAEVCGELLDSLMSLAAETRRREGDGYIRERLENDERAASRHGLCTTIMP
jgi:hypothetical protein